MSIAENVTVGLRLNGLRKRVHLAERMEQALVHGGALGRSQGPARMRRRSVSPAASSSGFASRARWRCNRRSC